MSTSSTLFVKRCRQSTAVRLITLPSCLWVETVQQHFHTDADTGQFSPGLQLAAQQSAIAWENPHLLCLPAKGEAAKASTMLVLY